MPVRRLRAACIASSMLSSTLAAFVRRPRPLPSPAGPPYSPADSMRTMEIEQGFRLELVVSEPDVQSPVAWTSTRTDASSSWRCQDIRSTSRRPAR